MTARIDLTGHRFVRLVVVESAGSAPARWTCRCDCGTTKSIRTNDLRSGKTQSCGCLHRDELRERNLTHGASTDGGMTYMYRTWACIKTRCTNPKRREWHRYGGRGITMYPTWVDSFETFQKDVLAEIGPRPDGMTPGGRPAYSIDRIDNDGNYVPGNLRWATYADQGRNTVRVKLTESTATEIRQRYEPGRGGNVAALAEEFGVSRSNVTFIGRGKTWRSPSARSS